MEYAKEKNTANVIYAVSQQYLGQFVCSIKSLLLHGGYAHYNVYILHSFFTEPMKKALLQDFSKGVTFHFLEVGEDLQCFLPEKKKMDRESYYRFLAPFLLLETLERALYLDADTIVINSLTDLYEMPFDGSSVICCTHAGKHTDKRNQERMQEEKIPLKLDPGVILWNLPQVRKSGSLTEIRTTAAKQKGHLFPQDQFLLAALYGDRVKLADPLRFNLTEKFIQTHNAESRKEITDLSWIREHTALLHFCGYPKPGDKHYTGILEPFYRELFCGSVKEKSLREFG